MLMMFKGIDGQPIAIDPANVAAVVQAGDKQGRPVIGAVALVLSLPVNPIAVKGNAGEIATAINRWFMGQYEPIPDPKANSQPKLHLADRFSSDDQEPDS